MGDPKAVAAQIRMKLPSLTPLEGKVASDILARKDIDAATPLREVAEKSDVSDAMVVKVAKKLGFAGFREFRQGLVDYYNSDTAALHSEISEQDGSGEIVQKVFRTAMQALEETFAILDLAAFDRAVDYLHRAKQRDFYGLGGSAQIARDVAHKFLRIGIRASVFDDAHMMMMSAALLGPDDVVVAFSHSGTTASVLDAVDLARRNGARIIAVTNYAESPLAGLVDVVLCSTAQNSPLLGENATARIAQLNLLDALFVATAQRDRATADQNLDRTMRAVQSKRRQ
ncbi:MurR/RpiR family transcriptional regulator [Cypionkella sp.]|uniref:MurR/RpiR family transcriptional regulator n=1 Tax=Cypionkella sp. TaxID=2811411 RepID=UPI002728AFE7|nr:MurR/RpiR family transcriptional regulator [Cypionkella sp.]MDO8984251.1 MurR/RpiR family transcriptional regulator [Cypionkella sp.]MDP2047924.1 MurR/RpiR family transcriptional regulator [Cypionkella sp.]